MSGEESIPAAVAMAGKVRREIRSQAKPTLVLRIFLGK